MGKLWRGCGEVVEKLWRGCGEVVERLQLRGQHFGEKRDRNAINCREHVLYLHSLAESLSEEARCVLDTLH